MIELFEKALGNKVSLWVDGSDLELSFSDTKPESEFIEYLRNDKISVVEYLTKNEINSEKAFKEFMSLVFPDKCDHFGSANGIETICKATGLQEGFVFHHLSQPDDDAYRVQLLLDYQHEINIKKYKQAWRLAALRYPILRTSFDWDEEGEILQVIRALPKLDDSKFIDIDIESIPSNEIDDQIQEIKANDREIKYDFADPGLIRITSIRKKQESYTVILALHHAIADGWSTSLLLECVHDYYAKLVDGVVPVVIRENAYIDTQTYYLENALATKEYWSDKNIKQYSANDINALFTKRTDVTRGHVVQEPGEANIVLNDHCLVDLKDACRDLGITLNVACQYVWHRIIQVYTGDDVTIVGTTVSGRDIPVDGIEDSVGLFINTLPVVVDWNNNVSVKDMLNAIQKEIGDVNSHSNISLVDLQSNGKRLFNSVFVFENYPVSAGAVISESIGITLRESVEKLDYPIGIVVFDQAQGLNIKINYDKSCFNEKRIEQILKHFQTLLSNLPSCFNKACSELSILSQKECHIITDEFNSLTNTYCHGMTLSVAIKKYLLTNDSDVAMFHGPDEGVDIEAELGTEMESEIGGEHEAIIYVLDKNKQPVPTGVHGEIYLVQSVGFTAEMMSGFVGSRQIVDDTITGKGKMLGTGCIGAWLNNGSIEHIGPSRKQVKVNGLRINLREVETVLCQIPGVFSAVSICCRHSDDSYLVAYIVVDKSKKILLDEVSVKEQLADRIAEYMHPDHIVFVDSIPVSPEGIISTELLPAPDFDSKSSLSVARNDFEKSLCKVWSDVLQVDNVTIDDSFYKLGGNSLLAIQLLAAIKSSLQVDIPLANLLELKTIRRMADSYVASTAIPNLNISKGTLSSAQERMLFLEQFQEGEGGFHIPYFVQIQDGVENVHLEQALNALANRHEILKTYYVADESGNWHQAVQETTYSINNVVVSSESELMARVQGDIHSKFDLKHEPSLRVFCYEYEEKKFLLFVWHHIAFDGWSFGLFFKDFSTYYLQAASMDASESLSTTIKETSASYRLADSSISYLDYSMWQREKLSNDAFSDDIDYWKTKLSGVETLHLPSEKRRPLEISTKGNNIYFTLSLNEHLDLLETAKEYDTTLNVLALTAFFTALASWSGQKDIVVGSPTDNREYSQTQSVIGYFVNTVALRCEIDFTRTVLEMVEHVHVIAMDAKSKQEVPFDTIVEKMEYKRDSKRHPIYQVMFAVTKDQLSFESDLGLPFNRLDLGDHESLYAPAKYDLDMSLVETDDGINCTLNYATDLFLEDEIERFAELYKNILVKFNKSNARKKNIVFGFYA